MSLFRPGAIDWGGGGGFASDLKWGCHVGPRIEQGRSPVASPDSDIMRGGEACHIFKDRDEKLLTSE